MQANGLQRPFVDELPGAAASGARSLAVMVLARAMVEDADLRALRSALAMPGQPLTLDQVAEQVTTIWNWVLLATVVIALIWLLVLVATYRGSRWARVVLTIMGGVWILLSVPALGEQMYGGAITAAAVALNIVLIAATLSMLYRADARRYFGPTRYDVHGPS